MAQANEVRRIEMEQKIQLFVLADDANLLVNKHKENENSSPS
jgi:hypothetical protein